MSWLDCHRKRCYLFQFFLLLLIVVFIALLFYKKIYTQHLDHILDFNFLKERAGFKISQTLIAYSDNDSYARVFWVGLLNTLLISILSIISATFLGIIIGVLRLSPNWMIKNIFASYINIFRNIPLLLQIFFWYFAVLALLPSPRHSMLNLSCSENGCLATLNNRGLIIAHPYWDSLSQICVLLLCIAIITCIILFFINKKQQKNKGKPLPYYTLINIIILSLPFVIYWLLTDNTHYSLPKIQGFNYKGGITIIPELMALWLSLTLYSAAYIAEYVRSGIQAIPKGQDEGARSLGLSQYQIMRLVIIPQALRLIIPPLTNQYLNIIKNTTLATAIAYPDLVSVFTGTTLNQTGRAVEIILITMAVYLLISLIISFALHFYHRHYRLRGKQ